jgi:hypothetical protein
MTTSTNSITTITIAGATTVVEKTAARLVTLGIAGFRIRELRILVLV